LHQELLIVLHFCCQESKIDEDVVSLEICLHGYW
jgi:hypothetical protein